MIVELKNVSGARILDRMGLKLASARFPPYRFDMVAGRPWRAAGLACGELGQTTCGREKGNPLAKPMD